MEINRRNSFERISSIPTLPFIGLVFLIKLLYSYAMVYFLDRYFSNGIRAGQFEFTSFAEEFFIAVLAAPVIETYLILYLPFKYLQETIYSFAIVILSSVLFGLLHHYNEYYQLYSFFSGLIYGFAYYAKLRTGNSFIIVTAVHMLYNACVVFSNHLWYAKLF